MRSRLICPIQGYYALMQSRDGIVDPATGPSVRDECHYGKYTSTSRQICTTILLLRQGSQPTSQFTERIQTVAPIRESAWQPNPIDP